MAMPKEFDAKLVGLMQSCAKSPLSLRYFDDGPTEVHFYLDDIFFYALSEDEFDSMTPNEILTTIGMPIK